MLYIQFFFLISLLSLFGEKKFSYVEFFLSTAFIFLIMSFRYGQGIDYFNYDFIFNGYKSQPNQLAGMELFYYLINRLVILCKLDFQWVIVITSYINILFVFKVINKYSKNKLLSLVFVMANYFLNFTSMIRQGVAMSIMIYGMCEYFTDRKLKKYIVYVLISGFFHTSAFLCIFLPLFKYFKIFKYESYVGFTIYSVIMMALSVFLTRILIQLIATIYPKYLYYVGGLQLNVFTCGLRYVLSIMLIYLCKKAEPFEKELLSVILLGNLILFVINPFLSASRVTEYFSFLEIILLPNVMRRDKKKLAQSISIILLYFALFCKDIKSFEKLGKYKSNSVFGYPYISVFDKSKFYRKTTQD